MRMWIVCESYGDFQIGAGLIDRQLGESSDWESSCDNAPWADAPSHDAPGSEPPWASFQDLHTVAAKAKQAGAPIVRGHFDGQPGRHGADMARRWFSLANHSRRKNHEHIDAIVLIWDMDGDKKERTRGLEQARWWARKATLGFSIAYGCPDFEIEAWLLAGFEPRTPTEREAHATERRTLGFCPLRESHRLTARADHDNHGTERRKSAKRVLSALVADDADRQRVCWRETSLDVLRERGTDNGLADYLREIVDHIATTLR